MAGTMQRGRRRRSRRACVAARDGGGHAAHAAHAGTMCKHVRPRGVGCGWRGEVVGAKGCVTSLIDSPVQRHCS